MSHGTRVLLTIVATAAALNSAACSSQGREAAYRERGERYFAAKNLDKARVELNNALQINPRDAKAQWLAGEVAEAMANSRDALGHYQAAVEADPGYAQARAGVGRIYMYAGFPDKALEIVEGGLKRSPSEPHLLTVRAAIEAKQGDLQAALRDAEHAGQTGPDDETVIALLSSLYRQANRGSEAIGIVQHGLEKLPDSVDLHYMLADQYTRSGQPAEAVAELRKIVAIQPKEVAHRFRLAQYLSQLHQMDDAERVLRDTLAVAPESNVAKLTLVQFIAANHGQAQAAQQIQQLLAAAPNDDSLRLSFAGYDEQQQNIEEARLLYAQVIAHAGTRPDGLTARVRLAALRLAVKDDAGAATLIGEVLKVSPSQAEALVVNAQLALNRGDPAAAVADLRTVLRDQPSNARVMRMLAQAHLQNNAPSLAEEVLRGALQANPKDVESGMALVQTLIAGKRPEDALKTARQLAQESPENAAVLEQLFRLQLDAGDTAGASESVATLVRQQPKAAVGAYMQGMLNEKLHKSDAALASYERALELLPESAEPLVAVVRLLVAAKQPDAALRRLETTIAAQPRNVVAKNLRAQLLTTLQRFEPAGLQYEDLIKQTPGWSVPYRGLAELQLAQGHDAEAVKTLQRGLQATHSAPELVVALGAQFERMGDPESAISIFEAMLKQNPRSELAKDSLATLLVSYRDDNASLQRAAALVSELKNGDDTVALDTRGWLAYRSGDYAQAVGLLRTALTRAPESPLLHFRLGMAQLKAGDSADAKTQLSYALRSGRKFPWAEQARTALDGIRRAG